MNIKKFLMLGGVALSLGTTSCVGDLDLNPIDPNLESPESPTNGNLRPGRPRFIHHLGS